MRFKIFQFDAGADSVVFLCDDVLICDDVRSEYMSARVRIDSSPSVGSPFLGCLL